MANETYTLIQKTTLNASAASITFSSIPQTFTDLVVKVSGKPSGGGTGGLGVQFNNTTTTYTNRRLYGDGSGAASDSAAITNYLNVGLFGNATGSNNFGSTEIYIPNYTSSNQKSVSTDSVAEGNSATQYMTLQAGLWNGTSAITSIKLAIDNGAADFVTNTTVSLYGVAKQGVTPTGIPKASGGDIITNDGTYWYHAFLNSGTFTPSSTLTADTLIIAGGGGGAGYAYSGGGGAGGLVGLSSQSLAATSHTVTVGSGGAGGPYTAGVSGTSGSNSQLGSLTTAVGGGGGGHGYTTAANGLSGGSGGGGGGLTGGAGGTGGAATSGQGFAGGGSFQRAGGSGGGAGAVGGTPTSNGISQPGGVGSSAYSSWGSVTGTGQNVSSTYYYAGGGAGNGGSNPSAVAGGYGGGGISGDGTTAGSGTVNTGGGGGGGNTFPSTPGGSGGSGIVIIRYAM